MNFRNKDRASEAAKKHGLQERKEAIERYYLNPQRCKHCGKVIEILDKQVTMVRKKDFCDRSCAATFVNRKRTKKDQTYERYKSNCKFKFRLQDFKDEFDFSLIKKHGFFHSKKNPKGVARDHRISINYGFKNGIDPSVISHPANCEIILQSENIKKFTKCSMTMNGLRKRIEIWQKKYGAMHSSTADCR
jgi:hypothetical protein